MKEAIKHRSQTTEISNPQSEIRNLPGLDASGRRYFEAWLAEVFAPIGLALQSEIGNPQSEIPMLVHGLNAWVCLEAGKERK